MQVMMIVARCLLGLSSVRWAFYPVCPVGGELALGTPLFDDIKIHLPNGRTFHIVAARKRASDIYVRQAMLNGKKIKGNFIHHHDIWNGGTLKFSM